MSSPKSVSIVEDPAAIAHRAEALRKREQLEYEQLNGTKRDSLTPAQLALCERVEIRNKALEAIDKQACYHLLVRVELLNALHRQASQSRKNFSARERMFEAPQLPKVIDRETTDYSNPEALKTAVAQLTQSLQEYERAFASAQENYLRQRVVGAATSRSSTLACYCSEVLSYADELERHIVGSRLATLRSQRTEADEIISHASFTQAIPLSAQTFEVYGELMASDDVGVRQLHLANLKQKIRDDQNAFRQSTKALEKLEVERFEIDKMAVLQDAVSKMAGWRVFSGSGADAENIYVAEEGFTNYLRKLQLQKQADGSTRLSIQELQVEGASDRVLDASTLKDEQREFRLNLCGKNGSFDRFSKLLGDSNLQISSPVREEPLANPIFPIASLPLDLREKIEGRIEKPASELQATIPRK
jgi:hypothetical protein